MSHWFLTIPNSQSAYSSYVRTAIEQDFTTSTFRGNAMKYFPDSRITQIVDYNFVNHILTIDPPVAKWSSKYKRKSIDKILKRSRKVFLIALYCRMPAPEIWRLVRKAEYQDHRLPFRTGRNPRGIATVYYDRFVRDQWRFVTPRFRQGKFDLNLSDATQIPIQDGAQLGQGTQGAVFRATINDEHHNFPSLPIRFAVKEIEKLNVAARERMTLQLFARPPAVVTRHGHIAKFYSGFTYQNRYYLITEELDGDLHGFMENYPNGGPITPGNLGPQWLKTQLVDLADALAAVHTEVQDHSIWHHDIKPRNILYREIIDRHGHRVRVDFSITDWGCSGSAVHKTRKNQGSPRGPSPANPTYLPPEARQKQRTSRKHDVWSLGCVFLEMLIWYTQGHAVLNNFRRQTRSRFYQQQYPNVLAQVVQDQLNRLPSLNNGQWARQITAIRNMLVPENIRWTATRVASNI